MGKTLGEFDLIARYFRPLAHEKGAFSLQDDVAHLPVPPTKDLLISKDILIAGCHFFAGDPPGKIARKALRCNLSDLVAKGATPRFFSLGLALPNQPSHAFLAAFAEGIEAEQHQYGWSLLGGDTTRSVSDLMISVTAYGFCDQSQLVRRDGAQSGDLLYVSGVLGQSALGLLMRSRPDLFEMLTKAESEILEEAYLLPEPPFGLEKFITRYASASLDVSDGLFADLSHLCRASRVSAIVEEPAVPFCPVTEKVLAASPHLLACALQGGDDYQALMAISPEMEDNFLCASQNAGICVTKIGVLTRQTEPLWQLTGGRLQGDETDLSALTGYTHF